MKKIGLTKGYVTKVDDDMYDILNKHKWWALDTHPRIVYACRWLPMSKPRIAIRMHHIVLGINPIELRKANLVVDHIDRDGLNNQTDNLRVATRRENILNSSYCENASGIRWDCYRGKFKAVELPDGKFIGWFDTREEALEAKGL